MDHEIGKGILRMLFDEMLQELPPEALDRIAQKVSAAIQTAEATQKSHIRRQLDIEELEREADVANRQGRPCRALLLQNQAESLRFQL